jgi:hypothetical protein
MAGRSGLNARTWSKRSVRTVFRKATNLKHDSLRLKAIERGASDVATRVAVDERAGSVSLEAGSDRRLRDALVKLAQAHTLISSEHNVSTPGGPAVRRDPPPGANDPLGDVIGEQTRSLLMCISRNSI